MPTRSRIQHLRLKWLLFAALCLMPGIGATQMAWRGESWGAALMYPLMSGVCALMYWRDKQQARAQAQRISERTLHVIELLGGWPGALVAQQLVRHKTRKLSFQAVFWGIVLLHQALWIDYQFIGRARLLLG